MRPMTENEYIINLLLQCLPSKTADIFLGAPHKYKKMLLHFLRRVQKHSSAFPLIEMPGVHHDLFFERKMQALPIFNQCVRNIKLFNIYCIRNNGNFFFWNAELKEIIFNALANHY